MKGKKAEKKVKYNFQKFINNLAPSFATSEDGHNLKQPDSGLRMSVALWLNADENGDHYGVYFKRRGQRSPLYKAAEIELSVSFLGKLSCSNVNFSVEYSVVYLSLR